MHLNYLLSLENTRRFAGTVPWMAPEIVNNGIYGAKVDVWSFGCTIIEMLCGGHPWTQAGLGKFDAMKRVIQMRSLSLQLTTFADYYF